MITKMSRPFVICALFVACGCGSNVRLSGTVSYEDGQPVPCGTVFFVKDDRSFQARGHIDSDGSYSAGGEKEKDGLPPGKYSVYIKDAQEEVSKSANGMPVFRELIDTKYAKSETSGLTVEVPVPKNRFDILVERKK